MNSHDTSAFRGKALPIEPVVGAVLRARIKAIMSTLVFVMPVLGAVTVPATAQTFKPTVDSEQVHWVVTFTVDRMEQFKPLVQKLVAATAKEPGVIEYEYHVGTDNKTVDIFERWADSKSAGRHITDNFGPHFAKEFLALAKPTRVMVYGSATPELKKILADFQPVYMTPLDGFTR